ncbi:MAG: TlpA disulfide reductase family protein [Saezia sp.]
MDRSRALKFLLACVVALFMAAFLARLWFAADNAPLLEYKLVDGSVLPSYGAHNKVVVYSFWSTSCAPCIAELPHLKRMYEEYREQGLEVVAIALAQDQLKDVVRMTYDKELPFKVAYDSDGRVAQAWGGIQYTPTVFVVNRKGQVIDRIVGSDSSLVESIIKRLL